MEFSDHEIHEFKCITKIQDVTVTVYNYLDSDIDEQLQ